MISNLEGQRGDLNSRILLIETRDLLSALGCKMSLPIASLRALWM